MNTPKANATKLPLFEVRSSTKLDVDAVMSAAALLESPRSFFSNPMRIRSLMSQPRLLRKEEKRLERKKRMKEVERKESATTVSWDVWGEGIREVRKVCRPVGCRDA